MDSLSVLGVTLNGFLRSEGPFQNLDGLHVHVWCGPESEVEHRFGFWGDVQRDVCRKQNLLVFPVCVIITRLG